MLTSGLDKSNISRQLLTVFFHVFFIYTSREASNSILTFLSDVFDLPNSRGGIQFQSIRDNVIMPRGASITRILIASLAGALPSNRFETVN